jgi:signal transduction histidine kinase
VEQEFPNKEETAFRVVTQGTVRAIKPEIRNEIYRIGREAIVNAYIHSEGSTIEVGVQYGSAQLRIFVRDDGRGIDSAFVLSGREGHWGLSEMRERSQGIGATFTVRSRKGLGTEIETVPGQIAFEDHSDRSRSRWLRWLNRDGFNSDGMKGWDKTQ